jgi:hypothetical protein
MKALDPKSLTGKTFLGEVLDSNDPEKEGRCKIKIFGFVESEDPVIDDQGKPTGEVTKTELPAEAVPWATPANGKFFAGGETKGFGDISIPKVGTIVKVQFPTGDFYAPEWSFIQNLNVQAVEEIQDSYEGSHIMLYDNDEQVKVFYTPGKGLNIFHKDSQIIVNPDSSITIEHAGSESIIELIGDTINVVSTNQVNITTNKAVIDAAAIELGEGAVEAVIKGNTFQSLFNAHTHIGNLGAPTSPPVVPLSGSELSTISKTK